MICLANKPWFLWSRQVEAYHQGHHQYAVHLSPNTSLFVGLDLNDDKREVIYHYQSDSDSVTDDNLEFRYFGGCLAFVDEDDTMPEGQKFRVVMLKSGPKINI